MKNFDFYEFTGILIPGVVTLYVGTLLFPGIIDLKDLQMLSIGGLGVFMILAYATGHLVGAIGNILECGYWKAWSGMPVDWVREPQNSLLACEQSENVKTRVKDLLGLSEAKALSEWTAKAWFGVTRQIHAVVEAGNKAARIHTFNGNYGMFRGMAAGLLACLLVAPLSTTISSLGYATLGACLVLSICRMHRFAKHYARELFVQFLVVQVPQYPTQASMKGESSR